MGTCSSKDLRVEGLSPTLRGPQSLLHSAGPSCHDRGSVRGLRGRDGSHLHLTESRAPGPLRPTDPLVGEFLGHRSTNRGLDTREQVEVEGLPRFSMEDGMDSLGTQSEKDVTRDSNWGDRRTRRESRRVEGPRLNKHPGPHSLRVLQVGRRASREGWETPTEG